MKLKPNEREVTEGRGGRGVLKCVPNDKLVREGGRGGRGRFIKRPQAKLGEGRREV